MLREDITALLVRGASGALVVSVAGTAVGFLTSVVLARLLGAEEYGIYIYILTWLGVVALVAQLGFRPSLVRFVAEYNARAQWGLFRGVLLHTNRASLIASVAVSAIAALIAWSLRDRIGISNAETFLIALPLIPLLTLVALRASALRALKHVVLSAVPDSIVRPILIAIAAVVTVTFYQSEITGRDALIINMCATFLAFLLGVVFLLSALPKQVRAIKPSYAKRRWWRTSLPMFFSTGMNQVLAQADIIMVGAIMGAKDAGIYAIASRLAGFVVLGKKAADTITAPMISELYSTEQRTKLHRLVIISARGVTLFTLLAASFLLILGTPILKVFGEPFTAGFLPLAILLIGHLFKASFASAGFLLSMTGHQDHSAIIHGLSAAFNLVLNFVLIPLFGLAGAALATAMASAMQSLLLMAYARKLLNINPVAFAPMPHDPTLQ